MKAENCLKIKDLEKRLACLEQRNKEIIESIANERETTMISDEVGNIPQLVAERTFVLKQIDTLKKRIKAQIKLSKITPHKHSVVEVGDHVKLQNHTHNLEVSIVNEFEANPSEGFISDHSPIGKAILGRSTGDEVSVALPSGQISYIIEEIE
jgi:transcription elongation factor GreA